MVEMINFQLLVWTTLTQIGLIILSREPSVHVSQPIPIESLHRALSKGERVNAHQGQDRQ